MATPRKNPVQLQIAVTLNPASFEFLEANAKSGDMAGTLASWCSYFVERQSRGGIFLEPEDHDALADLNEGKRFKNSRALVTVIQKGLKRDEGLHSFKINIDPAHYPALKENADACGMTVEESLDGIVQMIFSSNWVYDFTPNQGRSIPFTFEMLRETASLCEKNHIDSSDISGLIAEGRFLPISRETQAQAAGLMDKKDFTTADLDAILAEIAALRKENRELKAAPRELVAA